MPTSLQESELPVLSRVLVPIQDELQVKLAATFSSNYHCAEVTPGGAWQLVVPPELDIFGSLYIVGGLPQGNELRFNSYTAQIAAHGYY